MHSTRSRFRGLSPGSTACAAWLMLGCTAGPLETKSELPVQPEVVTEARAELNDAPTRSAGLDDGMCATQDDCAPSEICIAIEPGVAQCEPASEHPDVRVPPRAPNGRSAPPVGLLDGQVMRDFAGSMR